MAKTDPRTRPMPHHEEDTIHTHPTVVHATLTNNQHPYTTTGISVHHTAHALHPLHNITTSINRHQLTTTTPPTNKTTNTPTTPRPGTGHKTDTTQARAGKFAITKLSSPINH